MTRQTQAGTACAAGLALFVLGGPLLAGPLGYNGYSTYNLGAGSTNGIGYSDGAAGCGPGGCVSTSTGNCAGPKVKCPPPFRHVFEGPPCLKFKKGCPRPVCDPCQLPHFGYYRTCWSPWPYPPDWRHCPYPTASDMLPPPPVPPYTPRLNAERYSAPGRLKEGTERNGDTDYLPKPPPRKPETLPPPGKQEKDQDRNETRRPTSGGGVRLIGATSRQ